MHCSMNQMLIEGNDWSSREMSGTPPTVPRSKGYGVTATTAESVRSTWKQRKNLTDLKLKVNSYQFIKTHYFF
mgnify:CR=1 FL=1